MPIASLKDFLVFLKRRKVAIGSCALLFGLLGFLYGTLRQPRYTVCASVLISEDTPASALNLVSQFSLGNLLGGSASVDNEELVMNSHGVFTETVKELGLNVQYKVKDGLRYKLTYPVAPVMVDFNSVISDTLTMPLKFSINVNESGKTSIRIKDRKGNKVGEMKNVDLPVDLNTDYGVFNIFFSPQAVKGKKIKETVSVKSFSNAAEDLEEDVKIGVMSKRADAISLQLTHVNPGLGKLIIGTLIDAYNAKGISEKNLRGNATIDFIDKRISELSTQLEAIEDNLSDYKKKNNLTDIQSDVAYSFEEHGELQKLIIQQEADLRIFETLKAELENENVHSPLPDIILNTENQNSIQEYNSLLLRRKELARTAKEGNIALGQLDDRIEALRKSILLSVEQTIRSTSASLAQLKRRDIIPVGKMGAMPEQEKQLREILRNRQIQEQIYIFLLEQREQQAMNSLNSLPRGIVIDAPYVLQKPAGIGRLWLTLLGLFAGTFLCVGFFYLKSTLRE